MLSEDAPVTRRRTIVSKPGGGRPPTDCPALLRVYRMLDSGVPGVVRDYLQAHEQAVHEATGSPDFLTEYLLRLEAWAEPYLVRYDAYRQRGTIPAS